MRRIYYSVKLEDNDKSVLYILENIFHLSGYLIKRNKHIKGAISVNGFHSNVNKKVKEGDTISVLLNDIERKSNVIPAPGPLDILYEDDDIIILNKRAEDIVHPDHAHINNTLGNYLIYYYIQKNDPADFHPVHRLDNGTSGLIVFAKHTYAQNELSKDIQSGDLERKYVALCSGIIENNSGVINKPISRKDEKSIERCISASGQKAITEYNVIKRYNDSTLVELKLKTGRTHQLRVHLSSIGHPLIGDTLYGGIVTEHIFRPALHSYSINFRHPVTKLVMTITAPYPKDILDELSSKFEHNS